MEQKNAIIKSVTLGNTEHGFTAWVTVETVDGCQGFGGFVLYKKDSTAWPNDYTGLFVSRVIEVAGVAEWSDLPGRPVRVRHTDARIYAIGHILTEDWFDPVTEFTDRKAKVTR